LADYLTLVRERSGYLVVDDTQALGILGKDPGQGAPYGRGGGGTPAWQGLEAPELIIGSSLAKGLGVPLAVIAGNARVISKFENRSATRIHCSPPSLAVISATQQALAINDTQGDYLRNRLAKLVQHFKDGLRRIGLLAWGGLFPVQTLKAISGVDAEQLYRRLLSYGVRAVLHRTQTAPDATLSFLITTLHTRSDIDRCMDALQQTCALVRHECEQWS
jgi:8-amino-7-oxononanoate synthase